MASSLQLRRRAEADLFAIVSYISKHKHEPAAAVALGDKIISRCKTLVRAPGQGKPHLAYPEIRKINEGVYKIFYKVAGDKVVILRIWDGRRGTNPSI